jgi:hypothetical protein
MKFIPAIVLIVLAALCFLGSRPDPGDVDANVILLFPAAFFGLSGIVAAIIAWAL